MWFRSRTRPPGDVVSVPNPVSNEESARLAASIDDALDASSARDERDTTAIIQTAINRLAARISSALSDAVNDLADRFGEASTEFENAVRDTKDQDATAKEATNAKVEAEKQLRKTKMKVEASSGSRYPLLRVFPSPIYALLLVVASVVMGLLNTATFRVLGLPDTLTMFFAVLLAGLHGIAIHILPLGFRRSRRRDLAFWVAIAVFIFQIATSIILSQLRGDYLTILEISLEPWNVLAIPLLADSVALLASFIHGSEDAAALRQAIKAVRRATRKARRAADDLVDAENEKASILRSWYADIESAIRTIHSARRVLPDEVFNGFLMHLLKVRPLPAPVLQALSMSVGVPEGLDSYEQWLARTAPQVDLAQASIGRPSRHRVEEEE